MINPIYLKDFYKVTHYEQYPKGTTKIVSNFTPRKSRMDGVNHSVFFGLKYFIKKYLQEGFDDFFDTDDELAFGKKLILSHYSEFMKEALGIDKTWDHIEKLYKLGYLPIEIKALPEGSVVPCGVPALTIHNTLPEFYWLPNMLETLLSCTLWGGSTCATIAREYRLILEQYAMETSDIPEFVDYQAHDFSMRGMFGVEAAVIAGLAHLKYFKGTDNIPALIVKSNLYDEKIGISSVPATEHSVMSAGGIEDEIGTYRRLINDIYPSGIVSIVSDTWDLWKVVDEFLPFLKDDIMKRDGKVVIRPDSGDPADIICGTFFSSLGETSEQKGLIERLWDIFGGTINSKGYKQLDSHIGAIYGDSISIWRCSEICRRLQMKGFASTNIVLGIGSYSYQYNTRDTLGWAMKATYAEINGKGVAITKNPKTDDGTKKSHSGLLKVTKTSVGAFACEQNVSWDEFMSEENELKTIYKDGKIIGG